jgi:hypothetical protein
MFLKLRAVVVMPHIQQRLSAATSNVEVQM